MSALRTGRPRNAALNKERARVQYAHHRLSELREQGVSDEAAWDTIRAELTRGVVLLTRTELVAVIDPILAGVSRAWTPEGSVTAIKVADAVLAAIAKATGK
jgi:hypothetical protein